MHRFCAIFIVYIAAETIALSQSIPRGISRHYGGASPPTPVGPPQDASAASNSATELRIPAFLARHYAGQDSSIQNSNSRTSNLGPIADTIAPNDWLLQARATDVRRAPALQTDAIEARVPMPKTSEPSSHERNVATSGPVLEDDDRERTSTRGVAMKDAAESYALEDIDFETNLTRAQETFSRSEAAAAKASAAARMVRARAEAAIAKAVSEAEAASASFDAADRAASDAEVQRNRAAAAAANALANADTLRVRFAKEVAYAEASAAAAATRAGEASVELMEQQEQVYKAKVADNTAAATSIDDSSLEAPQKNGLGQTDENSAAVLAQSKDSESSAVADKLASLQSEIEALKAALSYRSPSTGDRGITEFPGHNVSQIVTKEESNISLDEGDENESTTLKIKETVESTKVDAKKSTVIRGESNERVIQRMLKKANEGDSKAQVNLGIVYMNGLYGAARSDEEAVRWFRKAAEQGNATAQNNLGYFYWSGRGKLNQNFKEALKWFRKAAYQGFAEAQSNIGLMYDRGHGVSKDYKQAMRWHLMAAERGYAAAQLNIGDMFKEGKSVVQSDLEAARWWQLAAEQGLEAAYTRLNPS